ncbi:MAG: hypothetical protein AAB416_02510 [Patescibacteria group bacterium]
MERGFGESRGLEASREGLLETIDGMIRTVEGLDQVSGALKNDIAQCRELIDGGAVDLASRKDLSDISDIVSDSRGRLTTALFTLSELLAKTAVDLIESGPGAAITAQKKKALLDQVKAKQAAHYLRVNAFPVPFKLKQWTAPHAMEILDMDTELSTHCRARGEDHIPDQLRILLADCGTFVTSIQDAIREKVVISDYSAGRDPLYEIPGLREVAGHATSFFRDTLSSFLDTLPIADDAKQGLKNECTQLANKAESIALGG